ncbi:D-amino-acid transaminase [Leucothrix pacifica]|uniref:Aminodeoxychorismate lyase n=1 Tax=Leucothrix pacifica TaxID=1247513 RepID=A0A317CHJ7_9GAMM|nr:D-amino-acid transaminase [Leucothrix pacifica]PWQ96883.1 D-amino acid aminotransferase [Leucothrix pacifica]
MSRIVYVNGEFVPEEDAKVSVFDRGFMFADGVYEVSSVIRGKLIDNEGHMVRLQRSMNELDMPAPATNEEIEAIQKQLIENNDLDEGLIYLQVTRGPADRDFAYPKEPKPSLVLFTQKKNVIDNPIAETGISVITVEDIRWARRDIKTVGLLAPCMAKMQAKAAGADDAWLVEDGSVTEGSSNNAYIVTKDGTIVTRYVGNQILNGITRRAVLALAKEHDYNIEERLFSVEECYEAAEAFVTSATMFVQGVVKIDGKQIGDGKPGPVAKKLREYYVEMALAEA